MNDPAHGPHRGSRPRSLSTTSLYGAMHALSDEVLESLCGLAASSCDAPSALLGLLEEEKVGITSWVGNHGDPEARALVLTLCGFALHRDAPFVIAELREEQAFSATSLVDGDRGLRFLAGAPLRDHEGNPVGALVIYDHRPHEPGQPTLEAIEALARHAAAQLELRRSVGNLRVRHMHHLERLEVLEGLVRAAEGYAIIATDPSGVITSFNAGAENMLRWPADEVIGTLTPLAFHRREEVAERARGRGVDELDVLLGPARHGETGAQIWTWKRRDGTTFPASAYVAGAHSEEGDLTGFVVIAQDITERIAIERMREEYVSNVSHELRTPLASIKGALQLLGGGAAGAIPESAQEILEIALRSSERLIRLVNDILELSRLESDEPSAASQRCELGELLDQAVAANQTWAAEHDVTLEVVERRANARVEGQSDRLVQVIVNLLSNAVKFSPRGGTVELGLSDGPLGYRISVRDHGPGIPVEIRARVFERFVQASKESGRWRRGSGLGLSIVQSIVARHGGEVSFETEDGVGTIFYVDLPAA